jgi:proteic killer suppression protein
MIVSISHKGLRLLWEKNDPSKLSSEQVNKIRRILSVLDTAKNLDSLKAIPGYRLHLLSGDLKGLWSVSITGNYRIVFRFEEENASDLNYVDYH